MVSESPHILSDGYAFKFDTKTNGLFGMVCPENVAADTIRAQLSDGVRMMIDDGTMTTCIFLPRQRASRLQISDGFDGTMLLFLRNLRRIDIQEEGIERRVWVEKARVDTEVPQTDSSTGILSVCDLHEEQRSLAASGPEDVSGLLNQTSTSFYVFRRSGIPLPSHLGDGSVDLTLAIPDAAILQPQQIFTFLPVQHSGFPFAVNARFELVSSRQQVKQDSLLNQFLRDEIAPTFIAALDGCEALKQRLGDLLTSLHASDPYWEPVTVGIIERVRSTPCILTESGRFVLPEAAIRRAADADRDLVSNDALKDATALEFVDSSMVQMAERLGCREFALSDLATIIRRARDVAPTTSWPHLCVDQLAENVQGSAHPEPQRWLQRLYHFIQIVLQPEDVETVLWQLPIFPTIVESGYESLESLAGGTIFASLPDGKIVMLSRFA